MGEYSIASCVDRDAAAPLARDTAVFVRRIEPPLGTVYTIICDAGGRARPWQAARSGEVLLRTGPVRLSTEHTYLAAWIPASQLPRQGNVVMELGRVGRDSGYAFRPSRHDEQHRRIQAVRWQDRASALTAEDVALYTVLSEIGLTDLGVQALGQPPLVRRQLAQRMIEELQEVKERELRGRFVLRQYDTAGRLWHRLLADPTYGAGGTERRVQMISAWQERLRTAAR